MTWQWFALTNNNSSSFTLFLQEVVDEGHSTGHSQILKGQSFAVEEL